MEMLVVMLVVPKLITKAAPQFVVQNIHEGSPCGDFSKLKKMNPKIKSAYYDYMISVWDATATPEK